MKRKISNIGILFIVICTFFSCAKDFEKINTNPNGVSEVLPDALLAPTITSIVSSNMNRSQRITNELMQVTVDMGDNDGKIFRYEIRPSEADYLWNAWYIQLTNLKDIYKRASDTTTLNKSYMAISLICQSWVYSLLTDTYGDVPYFQSNNGRDDLLFTPPFDSQKDIYLDIFEKLEEANTLLTGSSPTAIVPVSDPLYNGDLAKWRKFGNSLYLRLLMRLSGKEEVAAQVVAKIKEMIDESPNNYPLINSNDESAILKWTGSEPYISPFSTWRDGDWYGPKSTAFFVRNLVNWGDPRISKWLSTSRGEYAGVPGGYPPGMNVEGRSALLTTLKTEPLLGNIINYPEVEFLLAEAAARGFISSTPAQTYYDNGINNAITLWGITLPANYITNADITWDDEASLADKLEAIFVQKYYTLFFTDLQNWFEYRRTGHPVMDNNGGFGNGGVMPARLNYPVYVQSANAANYKDAVAHQGADNIKTQVWWQKP